MNANHNNNFAAIAAYSAMKAAEHTWVKSWDYKDMYDSAEYRAFEAKQIAYENICEELGIDPQK